MFKLFFSGKVLHLECHLLSCFLISESVNRIYHRICQTRSDKLDQLLPKLLNIVLLKQLDLSLITFFLFKSLSIKNFPRQVGTSLRHFYLPFYCDE